MSLLPPRYKACALRHQCAPKSAGGLMAPRKQTGQENPLLGGAILHALLDKAVLGRARQLLVGRRLLALGRRIDRRARLHALLDKAVLGRTGQLLVRSRLLALAGRGASGIFHALADKAGLGGAVKLFGRGLRLALQLGCIVGKDRIGQQHTAAEQAEQDGNTLHMTFLIVMCLQQLIVAADPPHRQPCGRKPGNHRPHYSADYRRGVAPSQPSPTASTPPYSPPRPPTPIESRAMGILLPATAIS